MKDRKKENERQKDRKREFETQMEEIEKSRVRRDREKTRV